MSIKINDVYIGGWFQRTMLQLSEIYDFLRGQEPKVKLNAKKLQEYRENLDLKSVEYGLGHEEYIKITTGGGVFIKIFEDGLIVLNDNTVTERNFVTEIQKMRDYYETRLSPALNYLFSLGAPAPKELTKIENVYPYFVVTEKTPEAEIRALLEKTEGEHYFEFQNPKYDVLRGDKYYFINNKTKSNDEIERYIEEQVFIREFKAQLHRYLNVHRSVWDKIDAVKSHKKIRGADIIKYTTLLEGYAKTISLIDGRIKQMGVYLTTREKIAKNDVDLEEFLEVSGYRYETLNDTLEYIRHLWSMTDNYVNSALHQFESLKSDVTSKSVNSLAIVTSVSAAVAVIELLTEEQPNFTVFGLLYFALLALIGWLAQKIINRASSRRLYELADVGYEPLTK